METIPKQRNYHWFNIFLYFFLCNFNIVTKLKLLEKNMEFETRTSTFKLKKKQMIYFQNKGFTFTLVCEN